MVNRKHIRAYKAKGVVLYKVSFTLLGFRVRKSNLTKVEAETFYHRVRRDILSGTYNEDKVELDLYGELSLTKFLRAYLGYLSRNTESRNSSIRVERFAITRLIEAMGPERKLKTLKPKSFCVAYQKWLARTEYSYNYRKSVRIFTNKLIKWGLKNNYFEKIKLIELVKGKKDSRKGKAFFTREELSSFFSAFNLSDKKEAYYYRFFLTQFQLALRVREVPAISEGKVNFVDGTVLINETYSSKMLGNGVELNPTKNNKSAVLPLSSELKEALREQLAFKQEHYPEAYGLFCGTEKGKNFDYTVHNKWFKKFCERAGIKGRPSTHTLRRSWVCFGVEAGLPLNLIASYSRHSPQVLLESYTEVKPKLFYQVFRQFEPLTQPEIGQKKDNILPQLLGE